MPSLWPFEGGKKVHSTGTTPNLRVVGMRLQQKLDRCWTMNKDASDTQTGRQRHGEATLPPAEQHHSTGVKSLHRVMYSRHIQAMINGPLWMSRSAHIQLGEMSKATIYVAIAHLHRSVMPPFIYEQATTLGQF